MWYSLYYRRYEFNFEDGNILNVLMKEVWAFNRKSSFKIKERNLKRKEKWL